MFTRGTIGFDTLPYIPPNTFHLAQPSFRFPAVPGLRLRAQWNGTLADAGRHLGRDDDRPRPAALSSHQATVFDRNGNGATGGHLGWLMLMLG